MNQFLNTDRKGVVMHEWDGEKSILFIDITYLEFIKLTRSFLNITFLEDGR